MEPAVLVAVVAPVLTAVNLGFIGLAYWRLFGEGDVAALRRRFEDDLASRIRTGYDESLARIRRAQARLAAAGKDVSATVREKIDALGADLARLKDDADSALAKLREGVSSTASAAEQALARRVRRVEAKTHVMSARSEIERAQRLAAKGDFFCAEEALDEAAAKIRDARARYADDETVFADVLAALRDAIRAVRVEAEDHKRQLDRLVAKSDALAADLDARDAEH